jgi:hypothetical protein
MIRSIWGVFQRSMFLRVNRDSIVAEDWKQLYEGGMGNKIGGRGVQKLAVCRLFWSSHVI